MTVNEANNPLRIFNNAMIASLKRIMEAEKTEAIASFNRQKSKTGRSTGALISSFSESPIKREGNMTFRGIVFAGGPTAPHAPFVEDGWKTKKGLKPGYNFMRDGWKKGGEVATNIILEEMRKVVIMR